MNDLHIDDFYRDITKIILALYANFPRPASIYVADISGVDEVDEFGLHSDRHNACFQAMLWLANEDLIRYADTIYSEGIDQAVLTHKALQWLSARNEHGLAIQQLHAALKDGSTNHITEIAQKTLKLISKF